MIVLDTDVFSEVMRGDATAVEWLDRQARRSVWITAVTVLEVRFGLDLMRPGRRRSSLTAAFERVVTDDLEGRILPFDRGAADRTAALMATRRLAGRERDVRDSMIAGIALSQQAALATRNVRHFDDLEVPIVNPWKV